MLIAVQELPELDCARSARARRRWTDSKRVVVLGARRTRGQPVRTFPLPDLSSRLPRLTRSRLL